MAPNPLLPPIGVSVVHRRAPSDPLAKATGVNGPIQGHLPLGPRLATVRADPLDYPQPGYALPGQISLGGSARPLDSLCNDVVEQIEGGFETEPRDST